VNKLLASKSVVFTTSSKQSSIANALDIQRLALNYKLVESNKSFMCNQTKHALELDVKLYPE
jgi:hypothetical protein